MLNNGKNSEKNESNSEIQNDKENIKIENNYPNI